MTVKGVRECHPNSNYSDEVTKYIDQFDGNAKEMMLSLRKLIHNCNDQISEKLAWKMPTFVLNGNLISYCGYKDHLNFYPEPSAINEFRDKLQNYQITTRGVQFKYGSILPTDVLEQMVKFRIEENKKKADEKKNKKKSK